MAVVKFPAYRIYEESRIEMNDAVIAILISLGLAENNLKTQDGSKHMLPEAFPHVKHIERMNLSFSSASKLLLNSESHLSTMALPYVMSLHEEYVMTTIKLLQVARLINRQTLTSTSSKTMHEKFENASGFQVTQKLLEQFHLIRLIRNSLIHSGGIPSNNLLQFSQAISSVSISEWEKTASRNPSQLIVANKPMNLSYGEIFATLSVTQNIAKELNIGLQRTIPKSMWSNILLEDFANNHNSSDNLEIRIRKLSKYAHMYYKEIGFSKINFEDIARQL